MAQPMIYTRAERLSDNAVHVLGLSLAAVAVPVLIWLAVAWRGDGASVGGVAIYGASALAMLGCSALYNMTYHAGPNAWLKRLDHSAIYLKIAGTYTSLAALTGGAGMPLIAGLWGVALGGTSLKMLAPDRLRGLGIVLYLGMGWVGIAAGGGMLAALSPAAWWLVIAGGGLYTAGVAVFLAERMPFHTTIWHAVVLIATALFYAAMVVEVARLP